MRGNFQLSAAGMAVFCLCIFGRVSEVSAHSLIRALESGEILSTTSGNAIAMAGLIQKPYEEVRSYFSGQSMAAGIAPLAFAKAFQTQDQRNLLYLKLRGLLDGTGLLMEVRDLSFQAREALNPLYEGAASLPFSLAQLQAGQMIVPFMNTWTSPLEAELRDSSVSSPLRRTLGDSGKVFSITLLGPLNPVMSLSGVSLQVRIDIRSYEAQNKEAQNPDPMTQFFPSLKTPVKKVEWTYLGAEILFLPAPSKEEIGDFKGFGQRQLAAAQWGSRSLLQSIRSAIESF
jgi:hypothetical protein